MSFYATIELSDFRVAAARSIAELQLGVAEAVRTSARSGAATAQQSGRFKNRTGFLRSNILAQFVSSDAQSVTWQILSGAPYSTFIEKGTRPHEIWPKASHGMNGPVRSGQTRRATGRGPHEHVVGRGQALRWIGTDGATHFAAMVHHPGTQPDPFMAPGLRRAHAVLLEKLDALIARVSHNWA